MYKRFLLLFQVICLVANSISCQGAAFSGRLTKPLIWSTEQLNKYGSDVGEVQLRGDVLSEADKYCTMRPLAITDKTKTFAPDAHYYCSIGIYWWPDPEHPGQYINKDGLKNPEINEYDNSRMNPMAERCQKLTLAYYISGQRKYYKAFLKQLNVWFIDKETYMYPNFEYAQVIPGQNDNKGRSTGMISAYDLNWVLESIRLVNQQRRLPKTVVKKLQQWFYDFAEWAETTHGKTMHKSNNNISLAFDVTMANMYLFAGNEARAKAIVDAFAALRIDKQIEEDGTQPAELKRTKAFSYSIFNLTHIIDMCYLAQYWYPDYYEEHRERIDKAFEFLAPYVEAPETFPYQQITSWEACKKDYNKQLERIKVLRGDGNN